MKRHKITESIIIISRYVKNPKPNANEHLNLKRLVGLLNVPTFVCTKICYFS